MTKHRKKNRKRRRRADNGDDGDGDIRRKTAAHVYNHTEICASEYKYVMNDANANVDIETLCKAADIAAQGRMMFEWMIAPVSIDDFYAKHHESMPLYVKRECATYYDGWFHSSSIVNMVNNHDVRYGRDLNITKYENDQRVTLDKRDERVRVDAIHAYRAAGCSVRVLCPQQYSQRMWTMLSLLDEHWCMGAGSNVYWTPAGTQGFAPHYDDIDAFILQVEGSKHWRLYAWRNDTECLDREPSPNLSQDELDTPIVDVVLNAGDFLYIPRGMIHQAMSLPNTDSLHITVSTGHKRTYQDWMEKSLMMALKAASQANTSFRKSLPRDYMDYMGVMHADKDTDERRARFCETVTAMVASVFDNLSFDGASDGMTADYLHDCVPPAVSSSSSSSSSSSPATIASVTAKVRMCRPRVASLSVEDDMLVLYHKVSNSRLYHDRPPQSLMFDIVYGPALEHLLTSFPDYIAVSSLPELNDDEQLQLAQLLLSEQLIVIKQ